MNIFTNILLVMQKTMTVPTSFGWFHLLSLTIMFVAIAVLYSKLSNHSESQLKVVLGVYAIPALLLELLKQVIWAFNYDGATSLFSWDYEWYAAPFQLCTTPIYVSLAAMFMKKCKFRDTLLSYLAFTTILGSIATIFLPDSCFTSMILVNIHTTWLHYGSFVVSVYLIMSKEVKTTFKHLGQSQIVFAVFVAVAIMLNILVYKSGILHGETFNMFYISPYFISSLPVFDVIQQKVPYIMFLLSYVTAIGIGSCVVCAVARCIATHTKSSLNLQNNVSAF
jgi:hypothetical protein